MLGIKNENEIMDLLLSSDIYCQVSHIENSPNSLCEAMLVGLPIVSTYAGGTASLLKDKEEGLLVQDGDNYAFASALLEIINCFEISCLYGKRAYNKANIRHDKKSITSSIINTYKSIILENNN